MLFSEYFQIGDVRDQEWFDTLLSMDTNLFIDPFLLYDNERGDFVGSHDEVIALFNCVFRIIAQSGGNQQSQSWKKAERLLSFPEVEELCLGYTGFGTGGAGSGRGVARRIAGGLWTAIVQGIEEMKHFEEIQIFEAGIGPDRISDATANILRHRIATYTQKICAEYDIPVRTIIFGRASFNCQQERWISGEYQLPTNPYNGKPIFLIPKRYIRPLPTINPGDYWGYCYDNEAEAIRDVFGEDITRNVNKEEIIELAKRHPETRVKYIEYRENLGSEPYDFNNDPRGVIKWYSETQTWVQENPHALNFTNPAEFNEFISSIIAEFRNFVENNRGWSLLWNENETPKREEASQLLFLGIVKHYCKVNDVDISAEANIGRGPVDFKVSSGYVCRALIEVKLAKNTKFWRGLERQLPKYLQAEGIHDGRFVVIVYDEKDVARVTDIVRRARALNERIAYNIIPEIIGAERAPPSASTL